MKKIFLLTLILIAFFTCGCNFNNKNSDKITNEDELIKKIEFYQYEKSYENLKLITDFLVDNDYLTYKNTKAPMIGFYMGILHDNPKNFYILNKQYGDIHLTRLLKYAYSYSESIEYVLSGKQKYYPDYPGYLDILWGYFYATGDMRIIKHICYIQKYDFDITKRHAAKRTLEKNKIKFPDKITNCNP